LNPRPALYEGGHEERTSTALREKGSNVDAGSPEIAPAKCANAQSAPNPEPSDAELERGIVDAVRAGLGDVARVLAVQLEARQRARVPANVVHLKGRG
jgi:hypothetical protein